MKEFGDVDIFVFRAQRKYSTVGLCGSTEKSLQRFEAQNDVYQQMASYGSAVVY